MSTQWMEEAACKGLKTDLFFPEKGGNHALTDALKRLCDRCPVQPDCLSYALRANITDGLWGGTTPNARAKIRRQAMRVT